MYTHISLSSYLSQSFSCSRSLSLPLPCHHYILVTMETAMLNGIWWMLILLRQDEAANTVGVATCAVIRQRQASADFTG